MFWLLIIFTDGRSANAYTLTSQKGYTFLSQSFEQCQARNLKGPSEYPFDNTIESIQTAFDLGADLVEIDIQRTKDNVLVLFHDWNLDCRTQLSGTIEDYTWSELKKVDFAYYLSFDNGITFPLRGKGLGKIVKFSEVLKKFPNKAFHLNPRGKKRVLLGDLLVNELRRHPGLPFQKFAFWGNREIFLAIKNEFPEFGDFIPNGPQVSRCVQDYSIWGWTGWFPPSCRNRGISIDARSHRVRWIWGWPEKFIERAHSYGSKVHAIYVEDKDTFQSVANTEIDSIITRDIGLLSKLRDQQELISTIDIKLTSENETKLRNLIAQTRQRNKLDKTTKEKIPARIRISNVEYSGTLRLRGDLPRHWDEKQPSLRVKINGPYYPWGIRTFDFMLTSDKIYELEQTAYVMARRLGLFIPSSGFSRLTLNLRDLGMYFWIERFGNNMRKRHQRDSGSFIYEKDVWLASITRPDNSVYQNTFLKGTDSLNPIRLFPNIYSVKSETKNLESLSMQHFSKFLDLLRSPKTDVAKLSNVLDVEKFAKWNALLVVFGSVHAALGDNLRWYLDHTTGLLEPIAYDLLPQRILAAGEAPDARLLRNCPFSRKILSYPSIKRLRDDYLGRLVQESQFDPLAISDRTFENISGHLSEEPFETLSGDGLSKRSQRRSDLIHNLSLIRKWLAKNKNN
ncbi:MAG: CotH kinase family protein [Oligoflexia bacterium]|nr:CotH kinase family protein [Oligoflexia bacterium]